MSSIVEAAEHVTVLDSALLNPTRQGKAMLDNHCNRDSRRHRGTGFSNFPDSTVEYPSFFFTEYTTSATSSISLW